MTMLTSILTITCFAMGIMLGTHYENKATATLAWSAGYAAAYTAANNHPITPEEFMRSKTAQIQVACNPINGWDYNRCYDTMKKLGEIQ